MYISAKSALRDSNLNATACIVARSTMILMRVMAKYGFNVKIVNIG